jgi:hypothetical protein
MQSARFADADDLLNKIPMIFVQNDGLDNILVDWTKTILGPHRISMDAY